MAKKPLKFSDDQPDDPPMDEAEAAALLSKEDIADVEAEVQAEIEKENKEAARKALKAKLRADAKKAKGAADEHVDVTVDLAPYCDRILLDNHAFMQGQTYTVPVRQAAVMREVMQKTWSHQSEIDGKSENFYRKTRGQRVVPVGSGAGVVNTSGIMRA